MDKYIKEQDIIDRIYPVDPENDGSDGCTIVVQNLLLTSDEIEALVNEIPSADVAPVVHARWVNVNKEVEQMCRCSACGYPVSYFWSRTEYCPHCGAKMDG